MTINDLYVGMRVRHKSYPNTIFMGTITRIYDGIISFDWDENIEWGKHPGIERKSTHNEGIIEYLDFEHAKRMTFNKDVLKLLEGDDNDV